jgi:hypothetical protein
MKGIKAVSFAPFLASTPVVNTVAGVVALPAIMGALSIARVEVRATANNLVETGTFDEATRTNEYVGVNTFFIPGNDLTLRNEIQTDAGILKTIFIEDYNGVIRVLGSLNGCDVMTLVSGSDSQGFTVTINSKEIDLAYTLAPSGVTAYNAALLPIV